jgi:hypothetical protein
MDTAQERSGIPGVQEAETSNNENFLYSSQRKRSGTPRRLQLGTGKYAKLQDEPKALWPDSNATNLKSVSGPVLANDPKDTETQQPSTSIQTFADLNDALTKSLLWKSTMSSSSSSPLFEFLSYKKSVGNKPNGWLRHDLGLRNKGHLSNEETKILATMYLALSGTTPYAASALAFAWGQTVQTMRSASKKHLQTLMTKEPPVEIGCQTEQTALGTSYADRGCQTEAIDQVNKSWIDRGCETDSICQVDTSRIDGSLQPRSGALVRTRAGCVNGGCQTESVGQVNTECQTEVSLLLPGGEHAQMLAYDIIMPRIGSIEEKKSNGMFFTLMSKDFREHQFVKLPKPRGSKGDRSSAVSKAARLLKAVNTALCLNPEEELKVAERFFASYGKGKIVLDKSEDKMVLDKSEDKISVEQLIAIRDEMHTSTNGVSKLVAAIKKFQPKLSSFFPTRVKHNIAKREREKRAEFGTTMQPNQLGSTDLLEASGFDVRHPDDDKEDDEDDNVKEEENEIVEEKE